MFIPRSEGLKEPSIARVLDAVDDKDPSMTTMRVAMADAIKQQRAVKADEQTQAPAERAQTDAEAQPVEFTDLYHQYFPKVFAYVYGRVQDKEISLDIVSDVFEKAFIKMRSLRSPDSPRALMLNRRGDRRVPASPRAAIRNSSPPMGPSNATRPSPRAG